MTEKFKPYRYEGCIIWSSKNQNFLKLFAKRLKTLTQKEKEGIKGNTLYYGGINYLILLNEHGKVRLASTSHRKEGPVFLSEGGYLSGE